MKIRPVQKRDFPQIFDIYMQGYAEAAKDRDFGDVNRLKKPDRKVMKPWAKKLASEIKSGDLIYIVAEDRKRVVGFCYVKKLDTPDSETSHVANLGIRVVRDMRGSGIGTALIKEIIKRSRGKFEILDLSVMAINRDAERLYRKFGFVRWGTASGYVKRKGRYIDQDHMSLRL